ncbi:Photosystem I assembly protein Ycf3 [uncultured archaeon]|nr:Photosystem I assembly protein Ycf3 [uncultured archaeon]
MKMEMLYNPSQMDKKELYDTFVARDKLLLELLDTVKDNTGKKSIQHIILLGARGIGKTHTLRIIENKVSDLHHLNSKWATVNVPEEQYGVFGLIDFFEYILKIIFHSSQLEKVDKNTYIKELQEIGQNKNKESLDKIVSIFKDISQKENKQFLLLIDNIDKILAEKITEETELEYLRSILMTENFLMIIGTSTSIFEEIALYDKAFFRFFKIIHLQNLNDKEVETLLLKRAEFDGIANKIKLDENKNKIKAITDLTGGYPRLILMLYEILEDKPLLDVLKTFNKLLDNLTPYYKHRMDDLAPQQQKIIDTIMLSDGVASPTDVAKITGWKPTVVTSLFKRLKDLSILRIKESRETKKKKSFYEISDRLFVIWYQMRYLGVLRRRIEYIVTFLKIWYDLEELKDKISSYALQYQQHYSRGNFSESYNFARSISIISCAITVTSEKEKIISEQVKRYITAGKFDDALNDLKDLLKIHEETDNWEGMASDFGNMCIVFQKQGDLQKSLEYYGKALKIYEDFQNRAGIANQYGNIWFVFQIQGDFQKSLEYYEKALKIHEKIGNREGIANHYGNMGS